ncbi:MAG: DUF2283 domain-containing protein [Candidatus Hodarchaeota archaeon]
MSQKPLKSWYDAETDILYIQVHKGLLADSQELTDDIRFDIDEQGKILGIEIHQARKLILEPISSEIAALLEKSLQPA